MAFPDEEAKLEVEDFSQRYTILTELGKIAQEKYDEYIVQGGIAKGYDLMKLRGSLQFTPDVREFENEYYLEGKDQDWTDIANYFEYGTGLYNTKRAGKYRAGYIKPTIEQYMTFIAKDGKFVKTKRVKGVHPIFAMEKAKKYIDFNRQRIQSKITEGFQDG